ncbi:hypothetical protein SDC9_85339 [bioreactor metagenome]|uniref:Uncharacterized protein n=1 Tax=bioreactor metagenome TaxID=1076179 RepID=A0A644ZD83_9ZZZZ|nr:hypothetical protein [Oscillospiraceae bacterium]
MISCTEFIPAYSELFKYIESIDGFDGVLKYWNHLGETGLKNLDENVRRYGIMGCYKYWSGTLNEEAADFTMTVDEEAGDFTIDMHYCPSKGRLLNLDYMEPYPKYCYHCDILYRRVLEPLGYKYDYDFSGIDKAKCFCRITAPGKWENKE